MGARTQQPRAPQDRRCRCVYAALRSAKTRCARRDKEAEEALLARCEATKKAKKRAQNADATDNPIGKRSA